MGSICQKQSSAVNQKGRSGHHTQETKNALHQQHVELANTAATLSPAIKNIFMNGGKPTNSSYSLTICPSADELVHQCWINKRGHVVRTWRRRYCVLDKSSLHYYAEPSSEPPYGKDLKGSIGLLGAICDVEESADGSIINAEIYGSYGEKDLLFSVENNAEGQKFVRILRWAIRKITLTMMVRNLKNAKSSTSKTNNNTNKSNLDSQSCKSWIENEQSLFQECIMNLLRVQLYQFVTVSHTGTILIRPAVMRLWSAFGDTHLPDIHTAGYQMGLAWHVVYQSDLTNQYELSVNEDEQKIITFEDIVDIQYHLLDKSSTEYLQPRITKFHPPNVMKTNHPAPGASTTSNNTNNNSNTAENYGIVSITTKSAHVLFILVVNIHDYYDAILSIQQIVLYLQARNKLFSSSARSKEQEAAQAMNASAVSKALKLISLQNNIHNHHNDNEGNEENHNHNNNNKNKNRNDSYQRNNNNHNAFE